MTKTIRLEEDTSKGLALLPSPQNKIYLHPKATEASLYPQIRIAVSKNGKTYEVQARQVVMSASISTDEKLHDYFWYYKSEVNFEIPKDDDAVPRPFLSSTESLGADGKKDPNRRHAVTPFPAGRRAGFLRRPDLIIVKDKTIRWPARAVTDHEGVFHADNLLRVVEIKFPGDSMDDEQEAAYTHIAGGKKHFTLLNVIDEGKPKKQPVKQPVLLPASKPENKSVTERQRALIYGPSHLPDPAFYEPWLADAKRSINNLLDEGEKELVYLRSGLKQLSQEVESLLRKNAQWMFSAGHWVRDSASHAWHYAAENGAYLISKTDAELKAAWATIQRETDLVLEDLKKVQWSQVLIDVGQGLLTAVLVIAGMAIVVVLTLALLVLLFVLIEIAAAGSAVVLTAIFGISVVTQATAS